MLLSVGMKPERTSSQLALESPNRKATEKQEVTARLTMHAARAKVRSELDLHLTKRTTMKVHTLDWLF